MSKIFLAHSSKDKEIYVDKIVEFLDKEIGRENFIYDKFNFSKGFSMKKQISEALHETKIFIVLLTKNTLESKWVNFEIKEAESLFNKNIEIICFINLDKTYKNSDQLLKGSNYIKYKNANSIEDAVNIIKEYYPYINHKTKE